MKPPGLPAPDGIEPSLLAHTGPASQRPAPPHVPVRIALAPWPGAIRGTVRIRGRGQRLEPGRTFKFVVALPKRG